MKLLPFLPAIVWSVFVFVSSIIPAGEFEKLGFIDIKHADKAAHFMMYAILAFLLAGAFLSRDPDRKRKFLFFSFLPPFLLGLLTEMIQLYLVPSRTGSIADMLANSMGIVAGILLASAFHKHFPGLFSSK